MHILFLTHYFPPEVNAPASRTFEHARHWVKNSDIKVTVVTNNPNHPKGILYSGYKNKWFSRETTEGIDVIRVKTFLAPNAGFVPRILNYLFFMLASVVASFKVKKPDIVIATSPQFFCAVAGYFVGVCKRKPFVFELRDIWPDSIVTVGAMRANFAIGLLEKLELFLYRKARLVIAVTDSFKENLTRRGIPPEKIVVIKNGVELGFFQPRPPSDNLLNELGAEEKFIVSYIGTIGMAHAVDKIVEAAECLKENSEILFLIVGEGADKAKVQEQVESKNLTNIKVLPGVSKEQVREFYALTHLNLVTLRNKPLFLTVIPSKIFEIMAMARPILTTVDGESRQIVESSGGGLFVEPENVAKMVETIEMLSKERSRLKEMGESGRQFVIANFERKVLADKFLTALRKI